MLSYTANQAKTHFGEFLDKVQREPVQVLKRDRVVGVMAWVPRLSHITTWGPRQVGAAPPQTLQICPQKHGTGGHELKTAWTSESLQSL